MKSISAAILIATLSLPASALAQSPGLSQGISSIGQALGLGSEFFSIGQQAKSWQSQSSGGYFQPGQPCYLQENGRLIPGRFYPVEKPGGSTTTECVATAVQP